MCPCVAVGTDGSVITTDCGLFLVSLLSFYVMAGCALYTDAACGWQPVCCVQYIAILRVLCYQSADRRSRCASCLACSVSGAGRDERRADG